MKLRLSVRIETGRLEKLRRVAKQKRKTMTQLIEDWIDRIKKLTAAKAARVAFPPRAKAAGLSSSRPIHVSRPVGPATRGCEPLCGDGDGPFENPSHPTAAQPTTTMEAGGN
ncbi:hypothetical protein E1H12_11175 [Geitlerinema sp. P-1104]|nr:hypothetical protein [Geitlerinema sp. P-1104]